MCVRSLWVKRVAQKQHPTCQCQTNVQKPRGPSQLTVYGGVPRRPVEGQAQGDHGRHLQDDEGDVLQGLPHQLQEGLWLLRGYRVLAVHFSPLVQVGLGTGQTWGRDGGRERERVRDRQRERERERAQLRCRTGHPLVHVTGRLLTSDLKQCFRYTNGGGGGGGGGGAVPCYTIE